MKTRILIALIAVTLAACAPAQTGTADIQNTAIAAAWTDAFLTQTAMPTATPPPPTVSPTATDVVFFGTPPPPTITPTATYVVFLGTPTPIPTLPPPPILTPNPIQVERWREYQTELAKVVLPASRQLELDPAFYEDAICEWDILGQSGQEVYVFAVCAMVKGRGDMRIPAIIYLEPDGSVREAKPPETRPEYQGEYRYHDFDPFPIAVQEKFCYYFPIPLDPSPCPSGITYPTRIDVLYAHLEYRRTHPDEPPLVVLLAPPTATPTP